MIEHSSEVAQLHERLSAQDEQIKQLTEEMARLRQMVAPQAPVVEEATSDEAPAAPVMPVVASKRTGRRGMLKVAAAGAAALGVAAVAVKGAPAAHAATGGNFILGNENDADSTTYVIGTDGTTPGYLLGSYDFYQTGASATYGNSHTGYGVGGSSDTGVDFLAYGGGRIQQYLTNATGAPTSGTYAAGEMIRDHAADMYICVIGGTPGIWFKVAAFDPFYAGGAINLLNPPQRVYDSRTHDGPLHGSSFRDITFTYGQGMVGNLTVTNTTGNGYMVIYPTGATTPMTSTTNYLKGQTNANSFIVGVGTGGQVRVHNFSSGDADFILDATGFVGEGGLF